MWQGHGAGALHSHDRMDALRAARVAGAGGLGMPPPEKFRSGHLPRSSVPLRPTSASSASDMDESSDADEDVEVLSGGGGGRYSVDSSPRLDDHHLPRRAAVPLYRYANVPAQGQQSSYYSSDGYSDLSSSRDTALPRGANPRPAQHQQARAAAYVEEEEYSDSAGSSEFSSHAARRSNGVASKGGYASEYSHTGPARREAGNAVPKARVAAASKPSNSRNHQQDRYSAHVPARDNANSSPKMVCFPC
jgi:hypothetical protein